MAKGNAKTIRFEPGIEAYIESWGRSNFSENLHDMVKHFREQEPFLQARLDKLKLEIEQRENRLREMEAMMRDVRWLDAALENLKKDISKSRNCFDEFVRRNTKEDSSQLDQERKCITVGEVRSLNR